MCVIEGIDITTVCVQKELQNIKDALDELILADEEDATPYPSTLQFQLLFTSSMLEHTNQVSYSTHLNKQCTHPLLVGNTTRQLSVCKQACFIW